MPGIPFQIEQVGGLFYVKVRPGDLGLYVEGVPGRDGFSMRRTADEVFAADPSVMAVIDGPMYDDCDVVDPCAVLDYLYIDTESGIWVASQRPSQGLTLAVGDGTSASRGADFPATARFAVQLYPTLVWGGVAQDDLADDGSDWHCGIGFTRTGSVLFALARDTMRGFAVRMARMGCTVAGYTDGGGSASLQVRGAPRVGAAENRAVASWIVARGHAWKPWSTFFLRDFLPGLPT